MSVRASIITIAVPTLNVLLNLASIDSMVAIVVERYQSHNPLKMVMAKRVRYMGVGYTVEFKSINIIKNRFIIPIATRILEVISGYLDFLGPTIRANSGIMVNIEIDIQLR